MHFLKVLYMDKVDDCCIYKLCKIIAVYNSTSREVIGTPANPVRRSAISAFRFVKSRSLSVLVNTLIYTVRNIASNV